MSSMCVECFRSVAFHEKCLHQVIMVAEGDIIKTKQYANWHPKHFWLGGCRNAEPSVCLERI